MESSSKMKESPGRFVRPFHALQSPSCPIDHVSKQASKQANDRSNRSIARTYLHAPHDEARRQRRRHVGAHGHGETVGRHAPQKLAEEGRLHLCVYVTCVCVGDLGFEARQDDDNQTQTAW